MTTKALQSCATAICCLAGMTFTDAGEASFSAEIDQHP
jgi:hypothetical protein